MGPSVADADVDVVVVIGPLGDEPCGFGDSVCFGEGTSVAEADEDVDVVVAPLGKGPCGFGDSVCFADCADGEISGLLVGSLLVFVVVATMGWVWPV